jgi:DNA invertase Pin-like site-specific DNA recombinase
MVRRKRVAPEDFKGRLIGYARVSTADQDVAMQLRALREAGVLEDNLWFEKVSGVKAKRPQRDLALLDARAGDVFVVYKLDRLSRSFLELLDTVEDLKQRGVGFVSLTENFDTSTAGGRFIFHVLGAMAEFERGLIAERTVDGMAEMKAQGRSVGKPRFFDKERQAEFKRRFKAGESVEEITASWGKTPKMVYTYFKRDALARMRRRPKRK